MYNIRKAGEGEDLSQWKKMTLKKKEKETESADEEEDDEVWVFLKTTSDVAEHQIWLKLYFQPSQEYECPQRAGRQKQVLDIDFRFADSRSGGGPGLRGRGGPRRDRGGRGGFRTFRGGRGSGRDVSTNFITWKTRY